MPALLLDSGFVQTIADLRSDRRSLLLFGSDGRFIRSTQLDIPMAFVSADPMAHRLIALRDIDERELVEYRWRWHSN